MSVGVTYSPRIRADQASDPCRAYQPADIVNEEALHTGKFWSCSIFQRVASSMSSLTDRIFHGESSDSPSRSPASLDWGVMSPFRHSADPEKRARDSKIQTEDEIRLAKLGYTQEVKRIFGTFTNFGLAASMISILLGIVPLYTYSIQTGGPAIMLWTYIVVGFMSFFLVCSLAEICSAFPTMGALYYWAFRLGGDQWGPYSSWMAGWCNLLGQIAGVASGAYAGAQILAQTITITTNIQFGSGAILVFYAIMLIIAGVVNTWAELMLTTLCYISVAWQIAGTVIIVIIMLAYARSLQSASFVFTGYNNETGFTSPAYVTLIGSLAAASIFTGYDTAAHIAEETTNSHNSSPYGMIFAVVNALILGVVLILGLNFCIQNIDSDDMNDITSFWQLIVGNDLTVFFQIITLVAIECSNCANLTSAARMIYSFSRDGALPFSKVWYHISPRFGGPVRAIWLSLLIAFLLGVPGLINSAVLPALFSLTATGLYASYIIPVALRISIGSKDFVQAEYNLGSWSHIVGAIAVLWGIFMIVVLCLPEESPVTAANLNYSPICLGAIILYAQISWHLSANKWFKVNATPIPIEELRGSKSIIDIESSFNNSHF